MEIENREKGKLRLEYEDGKPVMRMEKDGVKMTFHFAETPPPNDIKKVIVDILTSQYIGKVSQ